MAEESFEEHEFKNENHENFEICENNEEHDIGGMPEDSKPPQKEVSDVELGEGKEERWPGWPGENVFRMLVPVQKVGGIIGRKGEFIKKITEETKARIKILECPPGTLERAVSLFFLLDYLYLMLSFK